MTDPLNVMVRPRAPRWDKGQPIWTPRDLAVLTWIAEQYGVRRDHLAVLLGRAAQAETQVPGRVAVTTVNDWVQRWMQAGVTESTRVLAGQPSWVWLTRAGLDHLELEYRLWEPPVPGFAPFRSACASLVSRLLARLYCITLAWLRLARRGTGPLAPLSRLLRRLRPRSRQRAHAASPGTGGAASWTSAEDFSALRLPNAGVSSPASLVSGYPPVRSQARCI